jgi:hypothetical protein
MSALGHEQTSRHVRVTSVIYDEARTPVFRSCLGLGRLVKTSHAARYLRLDRRCHIRGHLSR